MQQKLNDCLKDIKQNTSPSKVKQQEISVEIDENDEKSKLKKKDKTSVKFQETNPDLKDSQEETKGKEISDEAPKVVKIEEIDRRCTAAIATKGKDCLIQTKGSSASSLIISIVTWGSVLYLI